MRVAIQGQKASFHDIASKKIWPGQTLELIYCDSFDEVFESVKNNQADFGLTAIENSLYGSIHLVYDLLLRHNFWISGETTLQIHQQLITHPNTNLVEITEVYSHPVALDQCRHWLNENLPHAEIIESEDTAGAVEYIKSNNLRRAAAIASTQAATDHEMQVLAADIEDEKSNFTRFIVIGRDKTSEPSANKASLSLTAHHKSGALYGALGILSDLGINLTKLESRPIRNQKFLYQFIIDLEADSQKLNQAVHELTVYGCEVTVLGHYLTHE